MSSSHATAVESGGTPRLRSSRCCCAVRVTPGEGSTSDTLGLDDTLLVICASCGGAGRGGAGGWGGAGRGGAGQDNHQGCGKVVCNFPNTSSSSILSHTAVQRECADPDEQQWYGHSHISL